MKCFPNNFKILLPRIGKEDYTRNKLYYVIVNDTVKHFKQPFVFPKLLSDVFNTTMVEEWFCSQIWQTGGARFNPQSRLSTQTLGVFPGFLQNSRKYGLGSLRKTPTEGIPPIGLGPSWTIGLKSYNQSTNRSLKNSQRKNVSYFFLNE